MKHKTSPLEQTRRAVSCGQHAVDLFTEKPKHLYCAESVLVAVAQAEGIESDLIPGISTGFCGGMSRMCDICGAVTGGVMGIGLKHGRPSKFANADGVYPRVQLIMQAIEKEFGSTNCKELTSYDLGNPDDFELFKKDSAKGEQCVELVRRCAELTSWLNHATDEEVEQRLKALHTETAQTKPEA